MMMQRVALRPYLIQPGFVRLPRDLPAAIWQQHLSTLLQVVAELVVALDKCSGVGRAGFREDDVDLEVLGRVLDVGFPLLGSPQKALVDTPFDVELVHISLVLYLTPRDDDVGLVARPVPIHWRAGRAAVIDQDLSIPPGLILVGDDVVLQVANFLVFLKGSSLSSPILQFKCRLVSQHLVHAVVASLIPQVTEDIGGLN